MRRHIGIMFGHWLGLVLMAGSLIFFGQAVLSTNRAFAAGGDDFNDNSIDNTKWGADITDGWGKCALTEVNGRLEYSCRSVSDFNEVDRPWILTELPYGSDWEIQIDVTNNTQLSGEDLYASFGIGVMKPYSHTDYIHAELYSDGYLSGSKGFYADIESISAGQSVDTSNLGVTTGAIRLAFNSTTKVIGVYYDIDPGDGYQWNLYGSFDINGSGNGADFSVNWGLADTDKLWSFVYGYSLSTKIISGELYGDNFQETGGVPTPLPKLSVVEGTIGTQITITGSGFGSKKGRVLLGTAALKIDKNGWSDIGITGTVNKVPLPAGSYPADFEVVVQTKHKPPKNLKVTDPFTVRTPWITSHSPATGTPGTPVIVDGTFFGSKKGTVYIEDQATGRRKNCKVTSWAMNSVTFIVPKVDAGSYWLYISNKVGTNPTGVPYQVE
ncbi:MAG: IPT/TIG domain-containing protein [Methanobacteriaceae archaeon]